MENLDLWISTHVSGVIQYVCMYVEIQFRSPKEAKWFSICSTSGFSRGPAANPGSTIEKAPPVTKHTSNIPQTYLKHTSRYV